MEIIHLPYIKLKKRGVIYLFLNKPIYNIDINLEDIILESFSIDNSILEDIKITEINIYKYDMMLLENQITYYLLLAEDGFFDTVTKSIQKVKASISHVFNIFIGYIYNEKHTKKFIEQNKSQFLNNKLTNEFSFDGYIYTIPRSLQIVPDKSFIEKDNWQNLIFDKKSIEKIQNYLDYHTDTIQYREVLYQFTNKHFYVNTREQFVKTLYKAYRNDKDDTVIYNISDIDKNFVVTTLANYEDDIKLVKNLKKNAETFFNKVQNYFYKVHLELQNKSGSVTVKNLQVDGTYKGNKTLNNTGDMEILLNRYTRAKYKEAMLLSIAYKEGYSTLLMAIKQRRMEYMKIVKTVIKTLNKGS